MSYADIALDDVRGHRQVTDTYLVGLASTHGGVLGTLDESLSARRPGSVVLIPHRTEM